ncbi:MAG: alanine--tRNA ligase, partial [Gammaproteobacteria bacterium]|nr:alanine--tRNA ligase [Gammaproteobacteria bacterium]
LMEEQRERARAASQFGVEWSGGIETDCRTDFTGYDQLEDVGEVIAIFRDGKPVEVLRDGEDGMVILERTPFYAESGGQIGDRGKIVTGEIEFTVKDTHKEDNASTHIGTLAGGELYSGMRVQTQVDRDARVATARNHSATHLMHAALRQVLGEHVNQKGSLVESGRLRFDFSHFEPVSSEQLRRIECIVNGQILENVAVTTRITSLEEALESGAVALFGEKYGDEVRMLSVGDYSTELCGGTHVGRSGDIGLFKVIVETGVAAGVRRIEAITGNGALEWVTDLDDRMRRVAELIKGDRDSVGGKVQQLIAKNRELEKEMDNLTARLASSQGNELTAGAVEVEGIKVLAAKMEKADSKTLRDTVDQLKNKLGTAVVVLAGVDNGKVRLVAGVTKDSMTRIKAGPLVNFVAQQVGGKGGGRPDLAQAGGNNPESLGTALSSVEGWVREQLR